MKNFIVFFFAGCVASTYGLNLGITDNLVGGITGGGDPAGAAINKASGKEAGLTSGPIISLPDTLGLGGTPNCIKLCATPIADEGVKCLKPTDNLDTPMCYQVNARNKYVWPCTNDRSEEEEGLEAW
ncbi:hypothetical protein HA402_003362 [Bradysia odoriphaga]|nr:hypothetical protein HA402_003362 [Bradysia odoriphaga]